jgi:phosphatidylserine/phosphatidylglycerophosphate/cardiolipin synthase-like enzyme
MGKGICPAKRQSQIPAGLIAFGLEPALCGQGRLDVEEREGCVKGSVCFRADTSRCYMGRKPELSLKHKIAHDKIMIIDRNTLITRSFNFSKVAEETLLILKGSKTRRTDTFRILKRI